MMPAIEAMAAPPAPTDPASFEETDLRSVAHLNPKQQRRIVQRRIERKRFLALFGAMDPVPRARFVHLSRHEHACKRQRGPGGRFLPLDQQPPEVQAAAAAKVAAALAKRQYRAAVATAKKLGLPPPPKPSKPVVVPVAAAAHTLPGV
tara:strand:- start:49 stop:492 length:444 start_codon:yes stop_codon:yes gene_type:complete